MDLISVLQSCLKFTILYKVVFLGDFLLIVSLCNGTNVFRVKISCDFSSFGAEGI